MKLFEMTQNRATLTESIRALMNKYPDGAEVTAEDKASLAKMEAEFDKLNGQILAEQKQLERERIIGEKAPAAPVDAKKAERMNAFNSYLSQGTAQGQVQAAQIYAALQLDNPTQAGYLVAPEEFRSELIKELTDATFMRQKARVLPPLKGAQSLGYPVRTAAMSSFAWGTELQAPTADTTLAYGKREFKPRPGVSEILISKTLARNVANIDALVRAEIAEEVGAALETAYMTGAGATGPLGLFVASADGINTDRDVSTGNTSTEIKFDGLLEAKYKVKAAYQPGCEWIFHRDAVKQLAKLKNSDGQYVWQASVVLGTPDLLLGKPVNMSEYAPSTFTTGLYVGIYGDLKNYWIVDSMNLEIQVLTELYARTNQNDYVSRLETDGAPVLSAAFARIKLGA
jgi:HK97 family phage major capsid protein